MAAKGGSWKNGKFTPAKGGGGGSSATVSDEKSAASKLLERDIAIGDDSIRVAANKNEFMDAAAKLPQGARAVVRDFSSTYDYQVGGNNVSFTSNQSWGAYNINFTVNGNVSRGSINPREGTQIAIGVRRTMQAELAARPVGSIFSTSAFGGDGLGAQRQALYERAGFGRPGSGGTMRGRSVMRNGRIELEPINE